MLKGKMFFKDITKNATLTVSNQQTGYEKKYLIDDFVGTFWRTQNINSHTIKAGFGAVQAIEGLFLLRHNILSGDTTYKAESSTDDFSGTEESEDLILKTRTERRPNNAGVITEFTRRDAYYADSWNRQYYRYRLDKASGSYAEAGQIKIFSDVYEFDDNFRYGNEAGQNPNFNININQRGAITNKKKYTAYSIGITFDKVDETQRDKLEEIADYEYVVFFPYGVTGPLYFGTFRINSKVHAWDDKYNINAIFQESL